MANAFSFKEVTTKTMKITGIVDTDNMTIDVDGDLHTHIHSKKLAETIINNVCSEKIPLYSHSRTLESMKRLSDNEKYVNKINELLNTRMNKGRKQSYHNPGIKKSF